jgi:hypothetical protein
MKTCQPQSDLELSFAKILIYTERIFGPDLVLHQARQTYLAGIIYTTVVSAVKEFCLGGTTVVSARSNFFTADTTVVPPRLDFFTASGDTTGQI